MKKKSTKKSKKAPAKRRRPRSQPEWTRAVAIQTYFRSLEADAMAAYMTHPAGFTPLIEVLERARISLAALTKESAARCMLTADCPPGWSCCDGICREYCNPKGKC